MVSGIERRLVDRVGTYLRNPDRRPGIGCGVCTTPVDDGWLCRRCSDDRRAFGEELADLVVPVTYGGHNAQSKTLFFGYKTPPAGMPGDERHLVVLLLLWVAAHRHRGCIERRLGAAFDAWTTVPSTQGRVHHPLPDIARRVGLGRWEIPVTLPADQPAEPRTTARGRFMVRSADVHDRHVLIVDDTWTTGGRAQSLALAARDAGARLVTIVVLARWLDPEWPPTTAYLARNPHRDFDPRLCPVTGAECP